MKFQVQAGDIKAALALTKGIRVRANIIPILGCTLVRADDVLRFTVTDMDAEISAAAPDASVAEPGAVCVDSGKLRQWVGFARGLVTGEADDLCLHLSCALGRISLPFLPAEDFPSMESAETPYAVDTDALAFCAPSASTEETRYYLRGVLVSPEGTVATDGHRMFCIPSAACEGTAIIPSEALAIIRSLPDPRVWVGERTWRAEAEHVCASGKLIEGTFPDWRRVMGRGPELLTVEADELAAAIKMALSGLDRDDRVRAVLLRQAGGELSVSLVHGAATTAMCPCEPVLDFTHAISGAYLLSACEALSGSALRIFGSDGVFRIESAGAPDDRSITIMAMRDAKNSMPAEREAA